MEVLEGEGVHLVDGTNCNVYLVRDGGSWIAVDSGMPGTHGKVLKYAEGIGARISAIVLTHHHVDHVGGASALKRATGATVMAGAADAPFIEGRAKPPGPGGLAGPVSAALGAFVRAEPVKVESELREGDAVGRFRVLEVPGHTPGSIALYDGRVILVGDALSARGGRITMPPSAFTVDHGAARRSAERIASLEFDVLLAGHGQPIVGGASGKVRAALGLSPRT